MGSAYCVTLFSYVNYFNKYHTPTSIPFVYISLKATTAIEKMGIFPLLLHRLLILTLKKFTLTFLAQRIFLSNKILH